MRDGGIEGSSAIGDGEQAAISLMPDVDGTGSGSLLDSVLSTLLKKKNNPVMDWVAGLFLSLLDDPVVLDSILNNIHVPFYVQVLCLKN